MLLTTFSQGDLADQLGATERQVGDWRRVYNWPHVRIGRTIRFTQEQVDTIIARHSQLPTADPARLVIPGQTKRSASRSSRRSA